MASNDGKGYDKHTRKLAFKLWRRNEGNFTAVSKYEGMPSVPTLIKWADKYDWEGKLDKAKQLVKEAFKDSDDPTLRKLVKDDAFLTLIVGSLRDLASSALKKRKNKIMPRTTTEFVTLLRFIGEIEMKLEPRVKQETGTVDTSVRKALTRILGEDEKGQEMAREVVTDMRKRLRLIRGSVDADEAAS